MSALSITYGFKGNTMNNKTPVNEADLQNLATPEIKDAAANILMNWKLAIFDAERNHIKALKKTKEQIEKVESVSLLSFHAFDDGRKYFSVWSRVESSQDGGKIYMTRIHKSGRGICECPDNVYRRRNCKHLVRLAIEILDNEPKGLVYII
jgi:hypothetical protein